MTDPGPSLHHAGGERSNAEILAPLAVTIGATQALADTAGMHTGLESRPRRSAFSIVAEPEEKIHDYLMHHNADPKPFVWTKSAEAILKEVRRALDALESISGNQPSESEH
jgi:hypothetical protein